MINLVIRREIAPCFIQPELGMAVSVRPRILAMRFLRLEMGILLGEWLVSRYKVRRVRPIKRLPLRVSNISNFYWPPGLSFVALTGDPKHALRC